MMEPRVLGLLLFAAALAGGAAPASAQPAPIVIDDFTAGPVALTVTTTANLVNRTQVGDPAHLIGGVRCLGFNVTGNPFQRQAALDIGGGHLVVDTGILTHHAVTLAYGWDRACEAAGGMHVDMSGQAGLRLDVVGLDRDTAGAIVVWTSAGIASVPLGMVTGERFKDVPFSDFVGDMDLHDVQYLAIVIQTGGVDVGHDYAIRSIKVLPALN